MLQAYIDSVTTLSENEKRCRVAHGLKRNENKGNELLHESEQ